MNKKQEAIAKLQQKIPKPIVRWILLGSGIIWIGNMIINAINGNVLACVSNGIVATLSAVTFLVLSLQAVFIKPILDILQDSLEDEDDGTDNTTDGTGDTE